MANSTRPHRPWQSQMFPNTRIFWIPLKFFLQSSCMLWREQTHPCIPSCQELELRPCPLNFEGILDTGTASRSPSGARNSSLGIECSLQPIWTHCGLLTVASAMGNHAGMFVARCNDPDNAHCVPNPWGTPCQQATVRHCYLSEQQLCDRHCAQLPRISGLVPDGGDPSNSVCRPIAHPPARLEADANALIIADATNMDEDTGVVHVKTVIGALVSEVLAECSIDLQCPELQHQC